MVLFLLFSNVSLCWERGKELNASMEVDFPGYLWRVWREIELGVRKRDWSNFLPISSVMKTLVPITFRLGDNQ